ncbi:MAG: hypothetical protein ACLFQK_07440 [Fibrobacterota bacterium]
MNSYFINASLLIMLLLSNSYSASADSSAELKQEAYEEKKNLNAAFFFGPSLRTGTPSGAAGEDYKEFLEELNSGYEFAGRAVYFPEDELGIGLAFSNYFSNNSDNNIIYEIDGTQYLVDISEKVSIASLGIAGIYKKRVPESKNILSLSATLGFSSFSDEIDIGGISMEAAGLSFYSELGAGMDFNISEELYLSLVAGLTTGSVDELKIEGETLELTNPESLMRLWVKAGISLWN